MRSVANIARQSRNQRGLSDSPSPIHVQAAGQTWESQAWDLLLRHLPADERRRQIQSLKANSEFSQGEFSPENLWICLREGLLTGVLLQIPQPGRVAYVWPPVVAFSESHSSRETIADALLNASGRYSDTLGIQFSQVALAEGETHPPPCLIRNGYSLRANLLLQERELDSSRMYTAGTELMFEPFHASQADRMAALLKQTYVGTADCPSVARWRSSNDALARHLAAGLATARNWTFVRCEEVDIGVLLMLRNEQELSWEIDYFGVVSTARGKGYGRQAIGWGMNFASVQGGRRIQAVVDSDNHYACKTYADCGFRIAGQRLVLLRMHPQLAASGADMVSTAGKSHNCRR